MTKAQKWLDEKYPRGAREDIKNIKVEKLQGPLKLEDFVDLEALNCCPCSNITQLEIINCPNLKYIACTNNKLTSLDLRGCPDLKRLTCSNNLLTNLDLSQNPNLEELYLNDNNFSQQDLTFLSHLVNLEKLELRNSEQEKIKKGFYNHWTGSLEPLKNLIKLSYLDIINTDIDDGLEYLSNTVNYFSCSVDWKRKNSKVKALHNLFANEQGRVETDEWERIKNFSHKLQIIKELARNKARKILAEELTQKEQLIKQLEGENFSLKEKVAGLDNDLTTEREVNQDSAAAMDRFYRQNPPREDIALKNILEGFTDDYLTINQENQHLKVENQELKNQLEVAEKLIEQEYQTQIKQPPKS